MTCCCFPPRVVMKPFSQLRAWLVGVSPWLRLCFLWLSLPLLLLTPGCAPPATRPSCAAAMLRVVPASTQSVASLLMACMTSTCPLATPSTRQSCAAPSTLLATACTEAAASLCTAWRSKGQFGTEGAMYPVALTVPLVFAPLAHDATSYMLRVVQSRTVLRRRLGIPLPVPVNGNPVVPSAVPSVLLAFACMAPAADSSMASLMQ